METVSKPLDEHNDGHGDGDTEHHEFIAKLADADRRWDEWAGPDLAAQRQHFWKQFWRFKEKYDAVESSPPDSWVPRRKFLFCEGPFRICPHGAAIPIWPHEHLIFVVDRRNYALAIFRAAKERMIDRVIDVQEQVNQRSHAVAALHQQNRTLRRLLAPRATRRGRHTMGS